MTGMKNKSAAGCSNSYYSIGADACKHGWIAAIIGEKGKLRELRFFKKIDELWSTYHKFAFKISVDIPIGLKESGKEERICDTLARKILQKPRSTSIFRTPTRQAVYKNTYREASITNKRITGKKISKQVFNITPKIKEVDTFLRINKQARNKLLETHPELCFFMLNNSSSMKYSKHSRRGQQERIEVLKNWGLNIETCLNNSKIRSKYLLDALDAAAVALSAHRGNLNGFRFIPKEPDYDARGLKMQIIVGNPN